MAFFSLTTKELFLPPSQFLTSTMFRKLGGNKRDGIRVRSFLIGQLGKNDSVPNNPITLQHIMDEIYPLVMQARELIGGRCIMLECANNNRLIDLYKEHDFVLAGITENQPESSGNAARAEVTMIRVIKN